MGKQRDSYFIEESSRRLKMALERQNGSIASLARLLGYTRQTVSAWVNGQNGINRDQAVRVAEALNCNPAWLLVLESDPKFKKSA